MATESEIQIAKRIDKGYPQSIFLDASVRGAPLGTLEYHPNTNGPLLLEHIGVMTPRRGIGRRLIQGFVREVGSGREIEAEIRHIETFEYLRAKKLLPQTVAEGIWKIQRPEQLIEIPFVRLLDSGGITTTELATFYMEDTDGMENWDAHYAVELKGVTR